MGSFFVKTISPEVGLIVIEHLEKCEECKRAYAQTKKFLGLRENADIDDYIQIKKAEFIREKAQGEKVKEDTKKENKEQKTNTYTQVHNKWTEYAKDENYGELANLKCISDFILNDSSFNSISEAAFTPSDNINRLYLNHFILKMSKRIDLLEYCLTKNVPKEVEEKENELSKK